MKLKFFVFALFFLLASFATQAQDKNPAGKSAVKEIMDSSDKIELKMLNDELVFFHKLVGEVTAELSEHQKLVQHLAWCVSDGDPVLVDKSLGAIYVSAHGIKRDTELLKQESGSVMRKVTSAFHGNVQGVDEARYLKVRAEVRAALALNIHRSAEDLGTFEAAKKVSPIMYASFNEEKLLP